MSKYQKYGEYKDSGVEWLGEIPNHWEVIQIGRLFTRLKRTGFPKKELLSVYRDYGVIPKSSRDDNNNKPSDDLGQYQLVKFNDLVMNKMKAWQGSIAISEYEGIVSPAYFVYEPLKRLFAKAFPKYVHYLLRNPRYIVQYLRRSKGIRVNQWDLDPEEFQRIELVLPPKSEQDQIFTFLDHETAKIDTLIDNQQKLIALLKEKRQAVISHAVTKGLNPDVPMKDSGVEWLGEVPEGWVVTKLKYYASVQGGYAFNSELFTDEGVQILRIGNVYQNRLALERQPIFIDSKFEKQLSEFVVKQNDVLMSLTGTLGKRDYGFAVKVEVENKFLLNQRVAKVKTLSEKLNTDYMLNILWSDYYLTQLYSLPSGTKQANLSNSDVLGIQIVIPPTIEEQKEINEVVLRKRLQFNCLISKAESTIEIMQERRTALIFAAVTGKIDVRNWQNPNDAKTELSA